MAYVVSDTNEPGSNPLMNYLKRLEEDPRRRSRLSLLALLAGAILTGGVGYAALRAVGADFAEDPRDEVRRFVGRVAEKKEPDHRALELYYRTLNRSDRQALPHEINYLLRRRGVPGNFCFGADGRLCQFAPPPSPFWHLDRIVESGRRGDEPDLMPVDDCLLRMIAKDRDEFVKIVVAEANDRLEPLGKAVSWDGRSFRMHRK